MKTKLLNKAFVWNAIGITLNSIYAIFLTMFISWIDGVASLGKFSYAFYITSLFYMIGNYGGRIYHVSDITTEYTDNNYVSLKYISNIIMVVIVILFCFINGYNSYKIILIMMLILYRVFDAISDSYYGVMQKNNDLEHVGKSMTFKVLISLILFIILYFSTNNLLISSLSFSIVYFGFTMFYDSRICKKYKTGKIKITSKTFELLKKCFPIFLFTFLTLLITNIARYFVDLRLGDVDQGYFGIIILPASLLTLFAQFLIQPLLINLVDKYNSIKKAEFFIIINKILKIFFCLGIIVSIIMFFVGNPLLSFIYQINLKGYELYISLIVFAGICTGGVTIIYNAMTIMRKIKIQIVLFLCSSIFAIILSFLMIFNLNNAFLAYFIMMIFQFVIFFIAYLIFMKKERNKENERKN